ncbi:protein of unknown function (plasmid) [Aminobacter niigataensis]|nr:protein of unknown function [Aminobacter niigataensis]
MPEVGGPKMSRQEFSIAYEGSFAGGGGILR